MLRMLYLRRQEREQNSVDLSLGSSFAKGSRWSRCSYNRQALEVLGFWMAITQGNVIFLLAEGLAFHS